MILIVWLLSWVIAAKLLRDPGAAFFMGIISLILFSLFQRIKKIEALLATYQLTQSAPVRENPQTISAPAIAPSTDKTSQRTENSSSREEPLQPRPQIVRELALPKPDLSPPQQVSSSFAWNKILGENPFARAGAIISFFGIVFLLKAAAENGFFPIELRLIASAIFSLVLIAFGYHLRNTRRSFGLILQGTGIGMFYVVTFTAYKMYELIPGMLTFAFFICITLLSAVLALLMNSQTLAFMGSLGGFLTPILISTGKADHVGLFSYIALLNAGVGLLCWYRAWQLLNLMAYAFTFIIGVLWADSYYKPEFFYSVQFFLIYFGLFFTTLNVIYSVKKPEQNTTDAIMTFGTPFLYSLLQWSLVRDIPNGAAISAASYGVFHIVIAKILFSKFGNALRSLVSSYLVIGLVLLSLAVPFYFSGEVSSAIWAIEAAALVWGGIREKKVGVRIFGLLLLPLASILFLSDIHYAYTDTPFINRYFIGLLLLTIGHLTSAILILRAPDQHTTGGERQFGRIALTCALLWWSIGGTHEVTRHINQWYQALSTVYRDPIWLHENSFSLSVYSLFATLSILSFWMIFKLVQLPLAAQLWRFLTPLHLVFFGTFAAEKYFSFIPNDSQFLSIIGIFTWPLYFVVQYLFLYIEERASEPGKFLWQHVLTLWLLIALTTWEVAWTASYWTSESWRYAAIAFVPALFSIVLLHAMAGVNSFPFRGAQKIYFDGIGIPVWFSFGISLVFCFWSAANPSPLPYIPIINPLDAAQALSLMAALLYGGVIPRLIPSRVRASTILLKNIGPWGFVWLTATLLRILHHMYGVPWSFSGILRSHLAQTSLSIFWTALSLVLMVTANQNGWRGVWRFGATWIAVVVIKLFLIDLESRGSSSRIIAFLGVGIILLCIGYFAPIPPQIKEEKK